VIVSLFGAAVNLLVSSARWTWLRRTS